MRLVLMLIFCLQAPNYLQLLKFVQDLEKLVNRISKTDFRNLLNWATKEPIFNSYETFYIQVDAGMTRIPLGLLFANIFIFDNEENWLKDKV